jgi:hypothetical protein
MHTNHCHIFYLHPDETWLYRLVVEGEELLALDLLEGLGVGWVSRRTSGDTERHDGGVLTSASILTGD